MTREIDLSAGTIEYEDTVAKARPSCCYPAS